MMSEQTQGHQMKTQTGGSSDACTTQDDGEMKLTLLYQDDWLVAVNKPSGLLVHRSWLDKAETRFAMQMTRDLIGGRHVYPVHRLDRPTSGVLLFALDPAVARTLTEAFAARQVHKEYLALVAENEGWANVPPGSRTSLYENPNYAEVPFAKMTLDSINAADPNNPTVDPVPYVGIQYVAIPEWAGIGTTAGQEFSAMVAGQQTPEEALERAQTLVAEEMEAAGY